VTGERSVNCFSAAQAGGCRQYCRFPAKLAIDGNEALDSRR
jgi:hypothetical protein